MSNKYVPPEVRELLAKIEQGTPDPRHGASLVNLGMALMADDIDRCIKLRLADERSQILNEANRQMVAHVDGQIDVLRREIAAERRPVRSWLRRLFSRFSWNTSDGR